MSILSHLSTSGWVLLVFTLSAWLEFAVSLIRPEKRNEDVDRFRAPLVAVLTIWMIWLVTP